MFRKTFVTLFSLLILVCSTLSCDIAERFRCNSNCDGYFICTNGIDIAYNCPEGQHCDMIEQNCSSEMSSCGPEGYQFKCSSEGIYPDPYDCTKYYVCGPAPGQSLYDPEPVEGGTDLKHSCPDGFAYNPGSTLCEFDLTVDVCKYGPIPKCEVLYQTESLRTNQSIFYICIEYGNYGLIPQLFRCDSGYYNSTTCKCSNSNLSLEKYSVYPCSFNDTQTTTYSSDVTEQSSEYTTEILSTTSSSITEQHTTTDTTITPPTSSISSTDHTTATTDNGIDSTTNEETTTESTISISSSITEQHTTTDTTITPPTSSISSTDHTTATTDNGIDSTTNEETTTESTISISSTEYSTEGTTSTLNPTTAISTAETEITTSEPPESTTHGEFICPSPGKFPDPYDCHSYYICNVHLKPSHYPCDEGSYFNPSTLECEVGDACPTLPPQTTETTTEKTSTHAPFQCDGPGIYPDCYDCHAYYRCTVTGHVFHEYCPSGYHFDIIIEDCIKGEDCPFQCDGPGIYPDCYDCHAYYRCTVTGDVFHEYCPSGYHFDIIIEDCIKGEDCPDVIC